MIVDQKDPPEEAGFSYVFVKLIPSSGRVLFWTVNKIKSILAWT